MRYDVKKNKFSERERERHLQALIACNGMLSMIPDTVLRIDTSDKRRGCAKSLKSWGLLCSISTGMKVSHTKRVSCDIELFLFLFYLTRKRHGGSTVQYKTEVYRIKTKTESYVNGMVVRSPTGI